MNRTRLTLLALAAGAAGGLAFSSAAPEAAALAGITQPVGRAWLNALQMTVVPLVLALVIVGVTTASDAAQSGRTARRALTTFLLLLAGSAGFAALAAPVFVSFLPHDPTLAESFRAASASSPATPAPASAAAWLASLIPSNTVAAAAQGAMVPLVVFALFFGFALTRVAGEPRVRVVGFFQAIAETMIVIVRWVLWVAPVGVFALMFTLCVSAGASVLSALGWYILLQVTLYVSVTLLLYGVALLAGGEPLRRFATAILPAQAIAASTQSSLASLPAMIDSAEGRLRCPREIVALVLPIAVSLFRITSPAQYVGVATFIAWAYGIELTAAQLAAGAALAVVISCGSVGLPGQVSFMTTNLPVTQAMGLPVEPLGLLIAVDTIPDVFATVGNVTGDLTATAVVSRRSARAAAPAAAKSHPA